MSTRALKIVLAMLCVASGYAHAGDWETVSPTRKEIQTNYLAAQQDAWNLFSGLPSTHVIPMRGKVTISAAGDYYNATAMREGVSVNDTSEYESRLELGGYRASPLVVFQEDRFGVGFGATVGKRTSEYKQSKFDIFKGEASFSGLQMVTYFVPKFSLFPKNVTTSFLVGGEKLYVTHKTHWVRPLDVPAFEQEDKARYSLTTLNVGVDVGILLSNRFTVMPWFDYKRVWSVTPSSANDASLFERNAMLAADQELFWHSESRYGLDLSVRLKRLTLHFGGVLGFLAGLAKGTDDVMDSGFSGGFTVDF